MAKGCASESLSRVTKITTPSQTGYALLTFNTSTDNNCLKIVTFNCHGFKSAMHDIRNMCMKYDIIFLQETWLSKNDNALLKDVDDNFDAFGISAMNDENGYQTGRPYGGLAVLWRKEFTHACTLLNLDDLRLLGVTFDTNLGKMLLVNTYLPYQCADNFEDYCNCLGKIAAIVHEADTRNIVITGDFNAGVNTLFEHELVELCKGEHLCISDYEMLGRNSGFYTYVSDAHHSTSWLDHVICSSNMHSAIGGINVVDKLPSSDHLPLVVTFSMKVVDSARVTSAHVNRGNAACQTTNWSNATANCKHAYAAESYRILGNVCIPDALLCKHVNCSNPDPIVAIDDFYHSINRSLIASSADTIRSRHYACRKRHTAVPGWNDTVKHAHGVARNSYIIWRNSGRPRHGPVSDDMRRSMLLFKYILKQCQRNEEQSKADAMAKSMRNHDMKSFWKEVSSTYSRNVPLATTVNGASDPSAICDMWKNQFKDLLNCVTTDTFQTDSNACT